MFTKAKKQARFLRMALAGPTGSGKTWTALRLASELSERIAVIDTEASSAELYAEVFDFETAQLGAPFEPGRYLEMCRAACAGGYEVLIVDSLSHEWTGPGGILAMKDAAASSFGGNSFAAWSRVSPIHEQFVHQLIRLPIHLIVTLRSKTAYVESKDSQGKTKYEKKGMAPQQREGIEYEFDIVGDIDTEHTCVFSKTRCPDLDGKFFHKPGGDVGEILRQWTSGAKRAPSPNEIWQAMKAEGISPEDMTRWCQDHHSVASPRDLDADSRIAALDWVKAGGPTSMPFEDAGDETETANAA